jgi:predicted NBD/HSP70 family sugar kinase
MASEQIQKRLRNQYEILWHLQVNGPAQRSQLSRALDIRKTSVTNIVNDLLERGILVSENAESIRSRVGLDATHVHALSAHVATSEILFSRIYTNGDTRDEQTIALANGNQPERVVDALAEGFERMRKADAEHILGIGVSMPGFIDPAAGVNFRAVNLDGWDQVPIREQLSERLGTPVVVENDVRCQLWSNTWFEQHAEISDNIIYLHVHEGISCAIMMHGKLITGENSSAGEIGQIRPHGESETLEGSTSIPALIKKIATAFPALNIQTPDQLPKAMLEEAGVHQLVDDAAARIISVLSGLVAALDPQAIVLGTDNRGLTEAFATLLNQHLEDALRDLHKRHVQVCAADEVHASSLKGIGGMVIHDAFRSGVFSIV